MSDQATPIAYIAPWVDFGGSDKGTIDWFRFLDRDRFQASLITTQRSPNRRLCEVAPYAREVWPLPDVMRGDAAPRFILDFVATRGIEVVHLMNSYLGFELLPDLTALSPRPSTVVQLHVEEETRDGYVRYVATRYGNLVDAFSVTSRHLAEALHGYGVSRSKIHVIYTGVDAVDEFDPARATPPPALRGPGPHVVFPARLVRQKDPLLMVAVAARVAAELPTVRFHVLGDGELEDPVRRELRRRGLERNVLLHPPTRDLASWYAGADLVLLTSTFEGVPYVAFEAMAMGVPMIVPELPGTTELLGSGGGLIISPRDDTAGYAAAILDLLADPGRRAAIGAAARARALDELSLTEMAAAHERLYTELRRGRPRPERSLGRFEPVEPLRFYDRSPCTQPRVSVIVACHNHGPFVREALDSVLEQDYPDIEVIVVDDGSTDVETIDTLDELAAGGAITLIRQENAGPAAARNRAVEAASGRYVLPFDTDNILLPGAVTALVDQLASAGATIGFVYPNQRYFGNRDDYAAAPPYDLARLTLANYCDTCSLYDADIFAAGIRWPEEIRLGHEDWDLALALARRGVAGEPARTDTLLFRKHGFTRSDAVEWVDGRFADRLPKRHGELYHPGSQSSLKARTRPALSVLELAPIEPDSEPGQRLVAGLERQTAGDLEVIVSSAQEWSHSACDPRLRRLPTTPPDDETPLVQIALDVSRGAVVLFTRVSAPGLLADAAFAERLLRTLQDAPDTQGIAILAHPSGPTPVDHVPEGASLVGLALRADAVGGHPPAEVREGAELDDLLAWALRRGLGIQGRAQPLRAAVAGRIDERRVAVTMPHTGRPGWPPLLPRLGAEPRRLRSMNSWIPAGYVPLCRHVAPDGRRTLTESFFPPEGFVLERTLGVAPTGTPPGTARIVVRRDGTIEPASRGEASTDDEPTITRVECVAFPTLLSLVAGVHPVSGPTIVNGVDDPLLAELARPRHLGFLVGHPLEPVEPTVTHLELPYSGLVRVVDDGARRHRYAIGSVPTGRGAVELGGVLREEQHGAIALLALPDGRLTSPLASDAPGPADVRQAMRWAGAPLAWRRTPIAWAPRVRATGRRTLDVARGVHRRRPDREGAELAGWLLAEPATDTVPLYSFHHPVTGDQYLGTFAEEGPQMGYAAGELLGHLVAVPTVLGTLEQGRPGIPWASRFGLEARRS